MAAHDMSVPFGRFRKSEGRGSDRQPGERQPKASAPSTKVSSYESRRERHRREVFERLVSAAHELLFVRSIEDATVQEITDKADVGKGTFFNYFPSKEHIIPEIIQTRIRALDTAIVRVEAGDVDSRTALADYVSLEQFPAELGGDWLVWYRSVLRALTQHEDVRLEVSARVELQRAQFQKLLGLGQSRGEFRDDFTDEQLARLVNRMIYGYGIVSYINNEVPKLGRDEPPVKLLMEVLDARQAALQPAKPSKAARSRRPVALKSAKRKR